MTALKPCPFCGGEASPLSERGITTCGNNDCAGYVILAPPEEWNRRAHDRAALVEVARRALRGPMRVYEEWELTQQEDWQDAVAMRMVDDYLAERGGNS